MDETRHRIILLVEPSSVETDKKEVTPIIILVPPIENLPFSPISPAVSPIPSTIHAAA